MFWRRRPKRDPGRLRSLRRAEAELREAERELEAVRERGSEIEENCRTLRGLSERNHFAPLVLKAFGGGQ